MVILAASAVSCETAQYHGSVTFEFIEAENPVFQGVIVQSGTHLKKRKIRFLSCGDDMQHNAITPLLRVLLSFDEYYDDISEHLAPQALVCGGRSFKRVSGLMKRLLYTLHYEFEAVDTVRWLLGKRAYLLVL